jgi:putative RNA 2'-phosphotransferase
VIDPVRLSKTLSHALRHAPWVYELELDDQGWVPLDDLLDSLREEKEVWRDLSTSDIESMKRLASKERFELKDGRIRAMYGHSIPCRLRRTISTPPDVLYHGTSPESALLIRRSGLKPMRRQNVHLSIDKTTALEVGRRKSPTPILLLVQAMAASAHGVAFYAGNEKVWLADFIPPEFIED